MSQHANLHSAANTLSGEEVASATSGSRFASGAGQEAASSTSTMFSFTTDVVLKAVSSLSAKVIRWKQRQIQCVFT